MAISDYEVRLLTSVYGVGRAEAVALGAVLNAIEAGPVPESVSLTARRAVVQLAGRGYSTVEAARLLYAIDNIVAGTPDAEQDPLVVNLLLERLKIGAMLSEPALLTAMYTEPAPTLVSAVVNSAGTTLTATFSDNVVSPGLDATVGFTVAANASPVAISAAVTSTNTIAFTIATVTTGQTVTLSYNATTGDIESDGGTAVATFSAAAVTNNSAQAGGYSFAAEALVFGAASDLNTLAGATDAPIRTNHDFTSAAVTPGGAEQFYYSTADSWATSGGFTLAVDSKVGWEIEFLEFPVLTVGDGSGTTEGLMSYVNLVFVAADDFATKTFSVGVSAMGSGVAADTLAYDGPAGPWTTAGVSLSSMVGKRVGVYVDATANGGNGKVGLIIDGTEVVAYANLAGWSAGDRILPVISVHQMLGANAQKTGELRFRVCNGAANMNGTGMPAGIKDVSGVAL